MIYVLNIEGKPLMPTTRYGKVRKLLKYKKAKVVKRIPFTIQLLYKTTNYIQDINLGVDTGVKYIGISATTKKQVLFEAELQIRNDIVELLSIRKQYRRNRRNRKTRYRKPRFNNRKNNKNKLQPSIQNKVDIHFKIIDFIHNLLPIRNIFIEVAQFDIQKIKNPEISGKEYQEGEQLNFWNVREYVLFRDKHTCQYCKGKSKDKILNVHHIKSRKIYGDRSGNLITLCQTCHKKIHSENLECCFKPTNKGFKNESQMNVMRWFIYNKVKEKYPKLSLTYGYITKNTRINNKLEKSHIIDARCISGNPLSKKCNEYFLLRQIRKNNRKLHKSNISIGGIRKNNKLPYIIKGFKLFDRIKYNNEECFIFGRRSNGYFLLKKLDGTKISDSASYKKLKLINHSNSILFERRLNNI
jgi:hypothetical protein